MPRKLLMGWEPTRKRWRKMYEGKAFYVSCHELNCPQTKEDSQDAANEWWKGKHAELEASKQQTPLKQLVADREKIQRFAEKIGDVKLAKEQSDKIELLQKRIDGKVSFFGIGLSDVENSFANMVEEKGVLSFFDQTRLSEAEKVALRAAECEDNAPTDRTTDYHRKRFLALHETRVAKGLMSAGGYDNKQRAMRIVIDRAGADADIASLTAAFLQDFYLWLLRHERWHGHYCKDVFSVCKEFIQFLAETDLIPMPNNIASKKFKFDLAPKSIKTFPLEELRAVYQGAKGQLKLHLLLMMNCGMTQTDISDLKQTEVDWVNGRIKRKRSKTKRKNSPIVDYKLWAETFKLLREFRSDDPETVLFTQDGNRWVKKELKKSKNGDMIRNKKGEIAFSKNDNIASLFAYQKDAGNFATTHTLREIRATSPTLLETMKEYLPLSQLFLAHSPRSIKDKHYVPPPIELLDEAIEWLWGQYDLNRKSENEGEADGPNSSSCE